MKEKMIRSNSFVLLVVMMMFLVGCAPLFPIRHQSRIYEKDIRKIELGSTKAKIYDLLGKPNFLENDRFCVYEVCGWLGGIGIMYDAIDFGGQIYRILLEFNGNDRLVNYEIEEGSVSNGKQRPRYPRIAISPNGKYFAVVCTYNNVSLFDLETKNRIGFDRDDVTSSTDTLPIPVFSPDSRYLVLIGDYVKVIDVANPSKDFLFKGHGEFSFWSWNPKRVTCFVFFPDGKKVVTGGSRGLIKIWELSTGTEIMTFKADNGEVDSIGISPDGKFIAAGFDDNIKIWDSTIGNEIMTFKTHEKKIDSIEFSPDGKLIATVSGTDIRIFDSTTGNELYHMISETDVFKMVNRISKQCLFKFSPDSKLFAVNRGTHIELWSINQERGDSGLNSEGIFKGLADVFLLPVFDEGAIQFAHPSLDFSNDSKIVAASYGSIVIYSLENRKRLWSYNLKSMTDLLYGNLIKYAALHPNGNSLIIYNEKEISRVDIDQEE